MIQVNTEPLPISPGAQRLIDAAGQVRDSARHSVLGAHHWLLALVDRHGPMAETLVSGISASALQKYLGEQLKAGNAGAVLDAETVLDRACARARERGRSQLGERDLAVVILEASGYEIAPAESIKAGAPVAVPSTAIKDGAAASASGGPEAGLDYHPRQGRPTPVLDQFARDLTGMAAQGRLSPLIGREEELEIVIETLCRRSKRNPVLVGPAGVGKTAIVEGLAFRVVHGAVPALLRNTRIMAIQPSTLVAGSQMSGELEKRVQAVLQEASQDGILLFVDEVHSMIGAGGMAGSSDVASLFKPVLARGDLACIAATTDDEYRRFIEPDRALERRFQPVRVQELTPAQTLQVLASLRDELAATRGIAVADEVLLWLVDFAAQYLPNRYFPDKAVDFLEQCVAHAVAQGKATAEFADAVAVSQRLIGMPVVVERGLDDLRQHLKRSSRLSSEDIDGLANRLGLTMHNLDMRSARPNLVMLLIGAALSQAETVAVTVAEAVFGTRQRIVSMDFSRFSQAFDVTALIGAPPGYVGYTDALPLHQIAQTPWCVWLCLNVDACHPAVRNLLRQSLADGYLTDGRGKRVYLSDTVVVMSAAIDASVERGLGFRRGEEQPRSAAREAAADLLGREFMDQVDLVVADLAPSEASLRSWLADGLLSDLAARYGKHGLLLTWDDSLIDLLLAKQGSNATEQDWARLVDETVSPLLVPYLPGPARKEATLVFIKANGGTITIDQGSPNQGGD